MRIPLFALLLLLALPALAQDAPPTEQSVRELLSLMQVRNLINTAMAQMDQTMRPMMQQALAGRQHLSEREQQIVDDAHAKIQAVMREQLRWESFERLPQHLHPEGGGRHEGLLQQPARPVGGRQAADGAATEHSGHAEPHGRHGPQNPADRARHGVAAAGAARSARPCIGCSTSCIQSGCAVGRPQRPTRG